MPASNKKPATKKPRPLKVEYCPLTFLTGKALKERVSGVIPHPKPIKGTVGVDIILTEVVREMGDRKPLNYAIPVDKLDKFIPNIGRATVKLITKLPTPTKKEG